MVLQEFFNISLMMMMMMMKSLQLLDLCFILLSPASSGTSLSSDFSGFTCKNNSLVELGENVNITCESSKEIKRVIVKFCSHHNNSCPDKGSINTEEGKYAADNGRIALKKNIRSCYLNIRNVKIFDDRKYMFCLKTNHGHRCLDIFLKVNAPYTIPEVSQQNDTTIVCNASEGYPNRQLYWFDKDGINLTHSSKLQAKKAEDGSFFLSSTLQVEPPVSEMQYCCSFNNTTCSDARQVSVWTTPQTDKLKSEEHTVNPLIPLAIVGAAMVTSVAVLCYLYKRKKGADGVRWPGGLTAFHQVNIFKWVEETA